MFCMRNGEYVFDIETHKRNHASCITLANMAMSRGCDVVVSNTFTTIKEMQPYLDAAKLWGHKVMVVKMLNDFGSKHNVPGDVIDAMADRWEDFSGEEEVGSSSNLNKHVLLPTSDGSIGKMTQEDRDEVLRYALKRSNETLSGKD